MHALLEYRTRLMITGAFVVALTVYAAIDKGLVEASAFAPLYVLIWLLDRRHNA